MKVHLQMDLMNITAVALAHVERDHPEFAEGVAIYRAAWGVDDSTGESPISLERWAEWDVIPAPGAEVLFSPNFEFSLVNTVTWVLSDPPHVDVILPVLDSDEVGSDSEALEILIAEGWSVSVEDVP